MTIDTNYIKPFTERFKLYLFKDRKRVKLTLMVTDTFGVTYLWNQEDFEDMVFKWEEEWTGKALGADIFVGPKKEKGSKNRFVRFSSSAQFGCEHRLSYDEMADMRGQYLNQRSNKMPWDK